MSTVRRRTQEDIVEYIKNHASDGRLTESLMTIGNNLGYSNATILRTLRSLEEQGVVRIVESTVKTRPNTIVYNGPIQQAEDIISKGKLLFEKFEDLHKELQEYIAEASRIIENIKEDSGDIKVDFADRIVDVTDLPDGNHYMVTVRKTTEEEPEKIREAYIHQED